MYPVYQMTRAYDYINGLLWPGINLSRADQNKRVESLFCKNKLVSEKIIFKNILDDTIKNTQPISVIINNNVLEKCIKKSANHANHADGTIEKLMRIRNTIYFHPIAIEMHIIGINEAPRHYYKYSTNTNAEYYALHLRDYDTYNRVEANLKNFSLKCEEHEYPDL